MKVNYLDLVGEGYMGSMQWQLGRETGTIPAFASRTQENQENLGRDGRSQDLPDSVKCGELLVQLRESKESYAAGRVYVNLMFL